MTNAKHRFSALDGMRGICALMVLVLHAFCYTRFIPVAYGYLSVDVFFMLSGFVIAFAFCDRLEAGLGLLGFVKARVRRLGPVHLFATLVCTAAFVAAGFGNHELANVGRACLRNLLLVPSPGSGEALAFPLNAPAWSLFAEFWVNVAFALIASRLTPRVLLAIVVGGWAILICFTFLHGTVAYGLTSAYVYVGVLRAVPAFACGVLIFKLWRAGALDGIPSLNPVAVFAAYVAISALPIPSWGGMHDIVQIILVIPAAIVLLVRSEFGVPSWALWLGRISYPLYATHFAVVYTVNRLAGWHPGAGAVIGMLVGSIALADAVARWYEPAAARALALLDPAPFMRIPEEAVPRPETLTHHASHDAAMREA